MEHTPVDEERFAKFVDAVYNSSYPKGMKAFGWPEERIRETLRNSLRGWLTYSVRHEEMNTAVLRWSEPHGSSKMEQIHY